MISVRVSKPVSCTPVNRNLPFAPKSSLPFTPRGIMPTFSAASMPIFCSQTIPKKAKWCGSPLPPVRASKDVPFNIRYPVMTEKPKWYWRTFACLFYLMPLHTPWMYAEPAHQLRPFLEHFEFLTQPFLDAIGRLPSWFFMAYSLTLYLGVVRKKEWPHFFRFHVVTAVLLESFMQMIGYVSSWMPQGVCCGHVVMKIWTAVAFAYLFTAMQSLLCALAGKYADIPFLSEAAYIQTTI